MSDLEERLAASLADGAEDAPGAVGLADGARRRARVRRRRRVSVGAVVAAVAVAVPSAVLGTWDDEPREAVVTVPDAGWRTVTGARTTFEVPSTWVEQDRSECDFPGGDQPFPSWGPPGSDPCRFEGARAVDSSTIDVAGRPGPGPGASGYVFVGVDRTVSVDAPDHETARRILASARPEGDPGPGVGSWTTEGPAEGLTVEVPDDGSVEVSVREGDVDCEPGASAAVRDGERWTASFCGDVYLSVTAPTQALADVVTSTVRDSGEQPSARWTTVEVSGVAVDVPPGWTRQDCNGGVALRPAGGSCRPGQPRVVVAPEAYIDWAGPSLRDRSGSVQAGQQVVSVQDLPRDDVRRVLASARPTGDAAVDVATWREVDLGRGVTAELPADPRVEVTVADGVPRCTRVDVPPARREGDEWVVGLCRDTSTSVAAPTRALADVVALQVRGY